MDNNHNQEREQPHLSRTQYRQQQREEQRQKAERHRREEGVPPVTPTAGESSESASEIDRTRMINDDTARADYASADEPVFTREATASERHEQSVVEKTNRLKKRLNIAIAALVVAIIIVYLILFYVG